MRAADIELDHKDRFDEMMWRSIDQKHIVVGYLAPDQFCENPLNDCDGMGNIFGDKKDVECHLGLEAGEPDLTPHLEYIARLAGKDPDDDEFTDDQTASAAQMWLANYKAFKTPSTWARALRDGGPGVQECDDDDILKGRTTRVWVPDGSLYEHINSKPPAERNAEAYKCFLDAIEEYNRWAEGDCYGIVVECFEKKCCGHYHRLDDRCESSWGYIGHEWALDELRSGYQWLVKALRAKKKS